jgi:hypothetical protein
MYGVAWKGMRYTPSAHFHGSLAYVDAHLG